MTQSGVYEFVFGASVEQKESLLSFWSMLGFTPEQEGQLSPAASQSLYGHGSELFSIRLRHKGCSTFNTGRVRLHFWKELKNQGLGNLRPIEPGSRWMGMYTQDILQLKDSFDNPDSHSRWNLWVSPLVSAPLAKPTPEVTFEQPFVGLRELLVFGDDFRLAFIQRGGFDRPGFGTFDLDSAFKNTEGSHANIVQPPNAFSTDFYKSVFDLETAPFGEAHDSGEEPQTRQALNLKPDETFRVERTRAKDCPSGLLQVYSSYSEGQDKRDESRPGSRNLCCYSFLVQDLSEVLRRLQSFGVLHTDIQPDEFGNAGLSFTAPDGYTWIVVGRD